MSRGPDFVVTMSRAAGSRRAGLATAAGITLGTAIWASVSTAGAGIVLARYQWAAEAVRYLGARDLAWLGLRLVLHSGRAVPEAGADGGERRGTGFRMAGRAPG